MGQSTQPHQTDAGQKRLEGIRENINRGVFPELSKEDRETLKQLDKEIQTINAAQQRFKAHWHGEILWYMLQFALEVGGITRTLQDTPEGEEAVDKIIRWVDRQDLAGSTKAGALTVLRTFADIMCDGTNPEEFDGDALPDRFRKIKPESHYDKKNPAPLPSNVLTWKEAIQMANTRNRVRDQALILFELGAGLRPMAELHKMQFKHVEDKGDHFVITTPEDSKTGRRTVYVFAGSAIFRKWLNEKHPAHLESEPGPNPETYVWTHYDKNKPIVYKTLSSVFKRAGKKAGIEKTHTAQHFRRSAASFSASKPTIGERELRSQFGWSRHSTAPDHYITTFSGRVAVHYADAYGAEVQDVDLEGEKLAPIICADCDQWTTRHMDSCIWCSHAIDEELQDVQHVVTDPHSPEKDLHEQLIDGDINADDLRSVKKLEATIQTESGFFENLDQLIMLADGFEEQQQKQESTVNAWDPFGISVGAYWSAAATRAASGWAKAKHMAMSLDPQFEKYPPGPKETVQIVALELGLFTAMVALLWWNGSLEKLLAGSLVEWSGLLIGTTIGLYLIDKELPSREEAAEALLEEMKIGR